MIRSLIGRGLAALAVLPLVFASPALAANISVKDGAGTTQTLCTAVQGDSSQAYCFVYRNAAGAQEDLATKASQAAANASLATIAGYTKPATSFAAITVGTAFTPGIGLAAICTAAGNIVLNGSDGSAITVPVNIGFNQFGFGVAKVASQTATCTFTNLL